MENVVKIQMKSNAANTNAKLHGQSGTTLSKFMY